PGWRNTLRELQRARGRYDQEVGFTDRVLGEVLERLRTLGVLQNAVVALVSDHGEGLWEHVNKGSPEQLRSLGPDGFFFQGHANHLYEEAIRTPFILWGTGVPHGKRIPAPVENVDLFPTLCALTGIDSPRTSEGQAQLEGRDLTRLF